LTRLGSATLALALLAGCSDADPDGYDEDSPIAYKLEEVFTIGTLDGEHDAFGRVQAVDFIGGNLIVLDNQKMVVSVFTADGEFATSFGGEGFGPGEFAMPMGLFEGFDGKVWVWDSDSRRFAKFDLDGSY
jgi:6-bladed beta-propeller protein